MIRKLIVVASLMLNASLNYGMEVAPEIENSKYALFKQAHKLQTILDEAEANVFGHSHTDKSMDLEVNSYFGQTQQGLVVRFMDCPVSVDSPWGRISLSSTGRSSCLQGLAVTQLFFNRLKCKCIDFQIAKEKDKEEFYEVQPLDVISKDSLRSSDDGFLEYSRKTKHISARELENYKGSESLVITKLHGNYVLYEITHIDGQPIAPLILRERLNYLPCEGLKKEWETIKSTIYQKN